MIPIIELSMPDAPQRIDALVGSLRLDARALLTPGSDLAGKGRAVEAMLADVAARGDAALVDLARRFDDPNFSADRLRVTAEERAAAHARCEPALIAAIRRSIAQVREYQRHVLPPRSLPTLQRDGVELGLRYTPVDAAGLHVPGGRASYPSSLIMLAVPAQVAGVRRIVVSTPASRFGGDALLVTAHELGIDEMYRAGGTGAIAAFALGTESIRPVDKIVGPGNLFIQLAKRIVAGPVGIDGFYGPSDICVLADASCEPRFVAADLLAQAEHDPGHCFLLTDARGVADAVLNEIDRQLPALARADAIRRGLVNDSAIVIGRSLGEVIEIANRIAPEHVNLQVRDSDAALAALRHAGAIFIGPWSPVAAGDYVAGPSHNLPTNATARFGGGISVFEFLKRSGTVRYASREALAPDVEAIVELAKAEGLDAHARSATVRSS